MPKSIENIFEYFRCPKVLSPIHDLPSPVLGDIEALNERPIEQSTLGEATPAGAPSEDESNEMEIMENIETVALSNSVTPTITRVTDVPDIDAETSATSNPNRVSVDRAEGRATQAEEAPEPTESAEDALYDCSPASPPPEECSSAVPTIIPLYTQIDSTVATPHHPSALSCPNDASQSIFDRLVKGYSHVTRTKLLNNNNKSLTTDESYTIASLRNSIELLCMPNTEWTSAAITICVEKMLKLTWRPMLLVKALLEVIEDTTDSMCYDYTPPSPAMSRTHQKCLLLIVRIDREIPSFMKYIEFQLERSLFQFSQSLKLPAMINLTHLYIGLIDLGQPSDRSKVRLFIYKCLYYYAHKATPMIYAMLMAHPHALPHANAIDFEPDPLVRVIVSIITNTRYMPIGTMPPNPMHRKNEMHQVLKRRYGYFADKSFPIDCAVDHCVECIRFGRLMNVDYALILLAKRQGCEWAVKSIIEKHLLPMLHAYVSGDIVVNTQNDERIRSIIFTIASIVKTFPLDGKIDFYLNIFVTCLNATGRPAIQEAAISAMCQLSRFGCAQIYPFISAWKKPIGEVSPKLLAMLNTVVYQKSRNFWYGPKS